MFGIYRIRDEKFVRSLSSDHNGGIIIAADRQDADLILKRVDGKYQYGRHGVQPVPSVLVVPGTRFVLLSESPGGQYTIPFTIGQDGRFEVGQARRMVMA